MMIMRDLTKPYYLGYSMNCDRLSHVSLHNFVVRLRPVNLIMKRLTDIWMGGLID